MKQERHVMMLLCERVLGFRETEERYKRIDYIVEETGAELLRILHWQIMSSRLFDPVIFLMGNTVIASYDDVCEARFFRTHTQQSFKILHCNELLPSGMTVSTEDLRKFFVLLELLVFKVVHFLLKDGDIKYGIDDDTFAARLRMLERHRVISERSQELLKEIKSVRNKFSHAISSVRKIRYFNVPMEECFRRSSDVELSHWFKEDAFDVTEELIALFKPHQHKQIDVDLFQKAAEDFLKCHRGEAYLVSREGLA